jgi:hypothetical protein
VLRVPEGALAVVSATRDGGALVPGFSTGTYIDGFAAHLRRNLIQLDPGASVSYELASDRSAVMNGRAALETSTLDASNQSNSGYWPVDEPGSYALDARYLPAAVSDTLCRASGDPVGVTFTVLGG